MRNLNSSQLAAFAEIIRCGSFDGAAQKLHVTSSAISQRVKQLEDSLGQVLIVRESPCRPTSAGQLLLRHAVQVELLERELFDNMGLDQGAAAQPVCLSVAVNADSLDGWFELAVEQTCAQARIMVDLRIEDQNHSVQMLRDGAVMAAISAAPLAPQGCSSEYLGSMRYLPLATPAFCARHFAHGADAAAFASAPVLVYNAKDNMPAAFVESVTAQRLAMPTHFIPATSSFIYFARRGLGWSMIPQHMAADLMATGELVEILPGTHVDIKLYFQRWQIRSAALDTLGSAVRAAARQQLNDSQHNEGHLASLEMPG